MELMINFMRKPSIYLEFYDETFYTCYQSYLLLQSRRNYIFHSFHTICQNLRTANLFGMTAQTRQEITEEISISDFISITSSIDYHHK